MSTQPMALAEIRRAGLNALMRELGPVGAIRFLQQYETGGDNYTEERHQWLGEPDVATLAEEIRRQGNSQA